MKKLLKISSVLAIGAGIVFVAGGAWGIGFTYQNVAREKIVTPSDASIPNKPVRGPFTLKSQADVIRKHALEASDGKVYAEMPRDADRGTWVTATMLTTALNLGILTYVFSGLVVLFGCISIWTGYIFYALSRRGVK